MSTPNGADDSYYVGPGSQPDKYRLVKRVGRGGEAQLWMAEFDLHGQTETVAIKILLQQHAEDFARLSSRWAEQAETLRFVQHPGVVGVREHFEGAPEHLLGRANDQVGRRLYLVMNWVHGVTLSRWLLENPGRTGLLDGLDHLGQVADTLEALHSGRMAPTGRAIVHGDLTPANIMIDVNGQAKLVDFGVTRLAGPETKHVMATPGYAAPEVLHAGLYTPASDRYGFGAVTYFMLTGQHPNGALETLRKGFAENELVRRQPAERIGEVLKIFSPDPDERPEPIEWLRLVLGLAMTSTRQNGDLRPFDPPPSRSPQIRKVLASIAVVAILVIVGIAVVRPALTDASPRDTSVAPSVTTVAEAPAPTPLTVPPVVAPTPTSRYKSVYENEILTIASGSCPYTTDVDLDEPRVDVSTGTEFSYGTTCAGTDSRTINVEVPASLTEPTESTPEQCADAIRTKPLGDLYLDAQRVERVCIQTDEKQIALIEIQSVSGSADQSTLTISASMWTLN